MSTEVEEYRPGKFRFTNTKKDATKWFECKSFSSPRNPQCVKDLQTRKQTGVQSESQYFCVQKSGLPNAGNGLFSKVDIRPNTIIDEYKGIVIAEPLHGSLKRHTYST